MSSSRLFPTPHTPPATLLRKHSCEGFMHASENEPPKPAQPDSEHASKVKQVLSWLHHHLLFGAEGEKSRGEPFKGQVGIGYTSNKRVTEDQERWEQEHPSHASSDPRMSGY